MLIPVRLITLFFLLFVSSLVSAFEVYGFIPWRLEQDNKLISDRQKINQILEKKGIKTIDVVYHNRMLTNGYMDSEKIKKIALASQANTSVPVSFDLEIGNRKKPETVLPTLLSILDLYHAYGGKAQMGVYSILPQSSVGGRNLTNDRKEELIELNKKYEIVATKVNFLSPVFYFSDDEDLNYWEKAVDFNMKQSLQIAKKYNLKVYPYITNAFRFNERNKEAAYIKPLTEKQMLRILNYLKKKGADGVIIWAGSGTKEINGELPVIKFNDPWFKGVQKFIAEN